MKVFQYCAGCMAAGVIAIAASTYQIDRLESETVIAPQSVAKAATAEPGQMASRQDSL